MIKLVLKHWLNYGHKQRLVFWMILIGKKILSNRYHSTANLLAIIMLNIVFIGLFYQSVLIAREVSFLFYLAIYTALLQGRYGRRESTPHLLQSAWPAVAKIG